MPGSLRTISSAFKTEHADESDACRLRTKHHSPSCTESTFSTWHMPLSSGIGNRAQHAFRHVANVASHNEFQPGTRNGSRPIGESPQSPRFFRRSPRGSVGCPRVRGVLSSASEGKSDDQPATASAWLALDPVVAHWISPAAIGLISALRRPGRNIMVRSASSCWRSHAVTWCYERCRHSSPRCWTFAGIPSQMTRFQADKDALSCRTPQSPALPSGSFC